MSTVLILGATSDIGVAIARRFASAGYNVQLAARNPAAIQPLAAELSGSFKITATTHAFDAAAGDTAHSSFLESLSPLPDTTVYTIGYMRPEKEAPELTSSGDETARVLTANYTGAVSILNKIAARYVSQKKGTILGISSVAGERGRQSNFLYGSAKAAFTAYLSGLRNYCTPLGVHVSTIKPGFVYTKMTAGLTLPPRLTATPQQVASAVYRAAEKKKNVVYVKGLWCWIMLVIRSIPEPIFKKLKL